MIFKSPEAVTTGALGPSPSKSLEVSVITELHAVSVVVTVVITSSSFTTSGSSLLQEEKVNTVSKAKAKIFEFFIGFKLSSHLTQKKMKFDRLGI